MIVRPLFTTTRQPDGLVGSAEKAKKKKDTDQAPPPHSQHCRQPAVRSYLLQIKPTGEKESERGI